MANTIESKSRKDKKQTKMCLKGGHIKDITDFYVNRDWEDQLGRDVWCKECVNRCATKDQIREYFWENHREWNDRMWETAEAKALKMLSTNAVYQQSSDQRRQTMLQRLAAQQIPTIMGTVYKYVENGKDGKSLTYEEAKANGEVEVEEDPNEKVYSPEFDGYFTPRELDYLSAYYQELFDQYDLDTINTKDYAKMTAVASLIANKTREDYRAGRCSFAELRDALAQFDTLSKSGCFSPSNRKRDKVAGLTSWGEAALKLETSGHGDMRKVEWPEDDVDRCIKSLSHIVASLGLDSM